MSSSHAIICHRKWLEYLDLGNNFFWTLNSHLLGSLFWCKVTYFLLRYCSIILSGVTSCIDHLFSPGNFYLPQFIFINQVSLTFPVNWLLRSIKKTIKETEMIYNGYVYHNQVFRQIIYWPPWPIFSCWSNKQFDTDLGCIFPSAETSHSCVSISSLHRQWQCERNALLL